MQLNLTLTGADSDTNITELLSLSERYPWVEWGILYHTEKCGSGRFPSIAWLQDLMELRDDAIVHGKPIPRLALHLCGPSANKNFAKGYKFFGESNERLAFIFQRVQMNVNLTTMENGIAQIQAACQAHPNQTIITQHNHDNRDIVEYVKEPNHAVLFDQSRGLGIPIALPLPLPFPTRSCGYAGGIGRDNLDTVLYSLRNSYPVSSPIPWIDMESSLRNGKGRFDLTICESILQRVDQYRDTRQDNPKNMCDNCDHPTEGLAALPPSQEQICPVCKCTISLKTPGAASYEMHGQMQLTHAFCREVMDDIRAGKQLIQGKI